MLLVGRGVPTQIPGLVHHSREVDVIINGGRNVGVVLNELVFSDPMIVSVSGFEVMMSLKGLKELSENLIFSFSTFKNSWMLFSVVNTQDI